MRTDVKVGIALGAIILIIAVSYYGTKKDGNISLKEGDVQLADAEQKIRDENSRTLGEILTPVHKPDSTTPARTDRRGSRGGVPNGSANGQRNRPPRQLPPRVGQNDRPGSPGGESPGSEPRSEPAVMDQGGPAISNLRSPRSEPAQAQPEVSDGPAVVVVPATPPGQAPGILPTPPAESPPGQSRPPAALTGDRRTTPVPARGTDAHARTHVIQAGDSFAKLAEKYYGSQQHAHLLVEANPGADALRLKIGSTIQVPPLPASSASGPVSTTLASHKVPANGYVVQEGDTLYGIASSRLGTGTRWPEIFELNRDAMGNDPSRLKVGQVLALPSR